MANKNWIKQAVKHPGRCTSSWACLTGNRFPSTCCRRRPPRRQAGVAGADGDHVASAGGTLRMGASNTTCSWLADDR